MKRVFKICVLCFLCISSCFCVQAKESECMVQVNCDVDTQFSFYKLDTFTKYPINFEDKEDLAFTLHGYVIKEGIKPEYTVLSHESLTIQEGTYVLIGKDTDTFSFMPSIVHVNRNVAIEPKYEKKEKDKINLVVEKKWQDNNSMQRPISIVVDLYRNQELYKSVTLKKNRGWVYTFKNLDASDSWQVVERNVDSNYLVSSVQEGNTVILTNTAKKLHKEKELPYTGQLWWPVPILMVLGIFLIVLGRKHEK